VTHLQRHGRYGTDTLHGPGQSHDAPVVTKKERYEPVSEEIVSKYGSGDQQHPKQSHDAPAVAKNKLYKPIAEETDSQKVPKPVPEKGQKKLVKVCVTHF
jgi:hypothetical protein